MEVLFLSSEVAPWSKTGGLADVASALPRALAARGHRVSVVSPRYGSLDAARFPLRPSGRPVRVELGRAAITFEVFEAERDEPERETEETGFAGRRAVAEGQSIRSVRWLFLDNPTLFARPGLYGEGGADYPDNALRFAAFCEGALVQARAAGRWPDLVHANDWQTGPAILRLALSPAPRPRTVFTVHNLAFQGLFPPPALGELGWPASLFALEALEFYGQVSFMKAGLVYADALTTVSPTYANEICTPGLGCGLDGLLRHRRARLHGILNGIDVREWDPALDPALPAHYSAGRLGGKAACKAALQREVGLPAEPDRPLFCFVGRLTPQKGVDLLLEALGGGLPGRVQLALLGSGDPALERALAALGRELPGSVAVRTGFDEGLAHRFEAGGDFFLMPSRFEPCGLNQMYSLRYGTPPVVRATGGLADTVVDASPDLASGDGFVFQEADPRPLRAAIERAVAAFGRPEALRALRLRGMAEDHSWAASAALYDALYRSLAGQG